MEIIPGLPEEIGKQCLLPVPYDQFPTLVSVSKKWKAEVESKEFLQQRKLQGFCQSLVALIRLRNAKNSTMIYRLGIYEPEKNIWNELPPVPGYNDEGLPHNCHCVGVGRYLVVIGDLNKTWEVLSSVYIYDLITAVWRRGADIPGEKRSWFGCASDSNRTVYVAGGHDKERIPLRSSLAYDVLDDKWIALPDMSRHRHECKGLFHGGKFHVIGGYQSEDQGDFDRSSETFDVSTSEWAQVAEDVLCTDEYPNTVTFDYQGNLYKCSSSHLDQFDGSRWRKLVELPADVRRITFIARWQKKMIVIGYGGTWNCYILDSGKHKEEYAWEKLEMPTECRGVLRPGCNLDL